MSCLLSVLRPVFYKLNQTFEAFRIFCSAAFCPTTTFTEVVLNEREFENAFKDSGYWDSFLLVIADRLLRTVIIFSLSPLSSNGIFEKASHLLYRCIAHVSSISASSVNVPVGELFVATGYTVALIMALCICGGFCFYL
jgi:hypothetical protein